MTHFLGYIGVWCTTLLWPIVIALYLAGVELHGASMTHGSIWLMIALNALLCATSDLIWAKAVLMTSSLLSTISLSLTIPYSLLYSALVEHKTYPIPYWIGTVLILSSFLLSSYSLNHSQEPKEVFLYQCTAP